VGVGSFDCACGCNTKKTDPMNVSPLMLLLVGGVVSLVSTITGIVVTHWLELRREAKRIKLHPTEVVYDKQTEFFDKIVVILDQINGYLTEIDVWLEEDSDKAQKKLNRVVANNEPLTLLTELLEKYYIYLPNKMVDNTNTLFVECIKLLSQVSHSQVEKCYNLLFSLQNNIREVIGTDALSRDLFKAFGSSHYTIKDKDS
jgi:hypothetical protein